MAKSAVSDSATAPWVDADEVPREGMPDSIKLVKRQKIYRAYVWVSLVLCPFLALFAFVAASKKPVADTGSDATSVQSSPGQATATAALRQWLGTTPAPLPGGQMVSWNGATVPSEDGTSSGASAAPSAATPSGGASAAAYSVEVDHFTVTNNAGALFNSDVQVAIDPRGGQVAVGTPSLIPVPTPISDNWQDGSPWPGYQTTANPPQPVNDAINTWMDAYISSDPDKLRLAVGDVTAGHAYTPLSGVQSSTVTANAASATGTTAEDEMLVQVTLAITWDGQPAPKPGQTDVAPGVTYDLLVSKASTAAPVVVAWGGPGTGPTLKPYGNAIDAANREAQPTASPSPAK